MIKRALVMLALASPLAAQGFVAGVRMGPNVSWNQSNRSGALLGAMSGVFATFDLGPVVSIQAEVNYSEKGWGNIFDNPTRLRYWKSPSSPASRPRSAGPCNRLGSSVSRMRARFRVVRAGA